MTLQIKKISNNLSLGAIITMSIFSIIIGVVFFTISYFGMKGQNQLSSLNQQVLDTIIVFRDEQLTQVMQAIYHFGEPTIFIIFAVSVALIWAIVKKEIWRPFLLISTTGLASVLSKIIKIIFKNPRPPQMTMLQPLETDFSFTSGHIVGTTIFCLILGYLIFSRSKKIKTFLYWTTLTIVAISIMTINRLYMGHHWLTDAIGAIGLCLVVFGLAIIIDLIYQRIKK